MRYRRMNTYMLNGWRIIFWPMPPEETRSWIQWLLERPRLIEPWARNWSGAKRSVEF